MKAWVRRLRAGLDRVALYLPLLVMALLALGSWSLVRSVPNLVQPPPAPQARTTPDYQLGRFSAQIFDVQGQLVREFSGAQARHFPQTDELHIDRVRISARSSQGVQVQASALSGVAPGNGATVMLEGQVQAQRLADAQMPLTVLTGERLLAHLEQQRLQSDGPVQIQRGRDRFAADRLDFDSRNGAYSLQGRVRVTLTP